jgi:uncharacterized membrane protein
MVFMNKKEVPFERVLFFSDAIVAIAITLLALELKIELPYTQHLSFADLASPWHSYAGFILSFINIASFWRTHHHFFMHINRMDEKIFYLNIAWLFFIVTLPFATSVLSAHFGDTAAVCLYSVNIFLLSVLQNFIWDYADSQPKFVDHAHITAEDQTRMRWMLNLDMLNALIAVVASFFVPIVAFFLLFFKIPMLVFVPFITRGNKKG